MINLNLEELKKVLNFDMLTMYNLHSMYTWTSFRDFTKDKKYLKKDQIFTTIPSPSSDDVIVAGYWDPAPYASAICFGRFTYSKVYTESRCNRCIIFTLRMNRQLQKTTGGNTINNFCWFTKEQISGWLDLCKEETGVNFSYDIEETPELYTITYNFKESWMMQMKAVLFWTRYLYECPANLYVLDALILKEKYFQDESILTLLNLVAFANTTNSFRMSDSQCISSRGKYLTREEWIDYINSGIYSNFSDFIRLENNYFMYNPVRSTIDPRSASGGYTLTLYDNNKEIKLVLEPIVTIDNLKVTKTSTGSCHYTFNPVKHWLSREDRFESRYIPMYNYLRSIKK